jgi:hypothetical protein
MTEFNAQGPAEYSARRFQNNRLSKFRLTRFDAVGRLILDGKCGARSIIVPMKR